LTQQEVADRAGIDRSYIGHIESGRTKLPSPDIIKALARALETTPEDLASAAVGVMPGGGAPPAYPVPGMTGVMLIPMVGEVSAGGGFTAPEGWEAITPPPGASRNLISFLVRGDCMVPRIEAGDRVIVDLARQWKNGSIVLARVDNDLLVKRAYREDNHIRLHAEASGYRDIVDHNAQVLGVVIRIEKIAD